MRFAVSTTCGRARTGTLYGAAAAAAAIETPALLLSTRRGLPSFVSRDLMAALPYPDSLLLSSSPLHFLESPSPKIISNIGGLHQMLGLQKYSFVAVARDDIDCITVVQGGANKLGASFETPSGRRLVNTSTYMELLSSLKPNLWATIADEVPAYVSEKRNKASVDRTLLWLDNCLALDPTVGSTALASIVGGSSIEQRKRCASEAAMRNVLGFWIGGFGLGESMDERPTLLNAVMDHLPDRKLRMVSGLGLPEEVLQGVAAGIDLFDSTYVYHLTMKGFGMIFPLDVESHQPTAPEDIELGGDGTKINLRATIYRMDVRPIVENCGCYTCQNHSRAYINHLLNVHEMLAQTLLEIHNTHHYLAFFRSVREAINRLGFDYFCRKFRDGKRAHPPAAGHASTPGFSRV